MRKKARQRKILVNKRILLIAILVVFVILLAGCTSTKLVSETCAFCNGTAEKNYTDPTGIDANISSDNIGSFTLKANETVSLCARCFGYVEIGNGKSK